MSLCTRKFLLDVKNSLADHPHFISLKAHGKNKSLKRCQKTIRKLLRGELRQLPQASQEFLLRLCLEREDLYVDPPWDNARTIRKELLRVAKAIRENLQCQFYEVTPQKGSIIFTKASMPQGIIPNHRGVPPQS